jgi:hypothetical protein
MNPIFSRTLKALCTLAVVGLLSACGSSSTVDSFKPTRVFALGDGYNVPTFTVTGTTDVAVTVAEQVAVLFGLPVSSVTRYAEGNALITANTAITTDKSLTEQITDVIAAVGTFNNKDLVVITIGTRDIKEAVPAVTAAADLKAQVARLLNAKAQNVLIMQPLEITNTPFGRGNAAYSGKTVNFVTEVTSALQALIVTGGYSTNPVIYGGTALSSDFNLYTTSTTGTYLEFSTSTQVPYCSAAASSLAGCAVGGGDGTSFATRLFADNLNLTPAGNRWAALRLFNATAQGWR